MFGKSKDILVQILDDMEAFAEMKGIEYPPIYLLGGSGCIIGEYLSRATTDFDLLDMEYDASMGRLLRLLDRYDFLDIYLTTIPEDFKQRAKKINNYKNVYVLSREDMVLSKIGRYSEKDVEDISILIKDIDRDLLTGLIEKVIGRNNISERVKEVFISNLVLFKGKFNV